MEKPLVSIILPVYNAQSHLARCLESVCGQTYKELEIMDLKAYLAERGIPMRM